MLPLRLSQTNTLRQLDDRGINPAESIYDNSPTPTSSVIKNVGAGKDEQKKGVKMTVEMQMSKVTQRDDQATTEVNVKKGDRDSMTEMENEIPF